MVEDYKDRVLEFDNESIVFTDPCYIMPHKTKSEAEETGFGEHMERVGYTKFITVRNGYGDGGWIVKNKKNNKKIGEIWADSGQTGVYLLDEVNKICPEFEGGCVGQSAAIIRGFTGTVKFHFREYEHAWEDRKMTGHILVIECSGKIADGNEVEFLVDLEKLCSDD